MAKDISCKNAVVESVLVIHQACADMKEHLMQRFCGKNLHQKNLINEGVRFHSFDLIS